eukprot:3016406-Amphidinium_carterae.1
MSRVGCCCKMGDLPFEVCFNGEVVISIELIIRMPFLLHNDHSSNHNRSRAALLRRRPRQLRKERPLKPRRDDASTDRPSNLTQLEGGESKKQLTCAPS